MARETRCMTPGAVFETKIEPGVIEVTVRLPMDLYLSQGEAIHLESTVHNALELALAPHFARSA